jgi:cephalosporin-C deacetylase-like acetyl esterase
MTKEVEMYSYRRTVPALSLLLLLSTLLLAPPAGCHAQSAPLDLWSPAVMTKIKDRSTLNPRIVTHLGYYEVYFDSETDAKWVDSAPPYAVHTGGRIRIHGYLVTPTLGGPYPAIVIGHGHGGRASLEEAIALAALGYVTLAIDGPGQGLSTGPRDTEQCWVSVEQAMNVPSPEVGYLYHYAYAGMRGLTLLERLSTLFWNPFRIDRNRLGVLGASMGGQFTYYINGADDRVKGAVAIAVAGDWRNLLFYEGNWLYHGLYYYTRDGLQSGLDYLNTVSNVCTDPTLTTFLNYFDPKQYAPTQRGPLLTIIGTHDQFFTAPAINTTYDSVASAGTVARFIKRVMIVPNGKHGVVDNGQLYTGIQQVIGNVDTWLKYCFKNGPVPAATPTIQMQVVGSSMQFSVTAPPGSTAVQRVDLYYATQMDSTPTTAQDFASIPLSLQGGVYVGSIPIGTLPPSGPAVTPDNVIYLAAVRDGAGYNLTSKLYYKSGVMDFGQGFVPRIEHWYRDTYPVPPVPRCP